MRRLAWFAGGFGGACLLGCLSLYGWRPALLCAGVWVLALALWLAVRPRGQTVPALLPARRRLTFQIARRALALFLGAGIAFLWFWGYSALFRAPARALAGTEREISGTVASYPEETSIGGRSLLLRLDGGFTAPDVLLYGGAEFDGLTPGDRVRCTARLRSSDLLYGEESTYYTARGVYLLAYCDETPVVEKAGAVPLRYWPALCARALRAGIYAAFDALAAPLAGAVTLGDKSGLDDQLYSALNRAGIMHAAVVSGMHISFLVSLFLLLCRGRRGAALCLIPVLLFYALMAGATPSALRAVIMQGAVLAAPVLRREGDSPTALGLALLLLLPQNPFAAASVSLQLSFASVAGILLLTHRLNRGLLRPLSHRLRGAGLLPRLGRQLWRFGAGSLSVTLGAMLFTVPLMALQFGQILVLSPLTNLLCLWAVTLLMVPALGVGTLALFLPGLALPLGRVFGLAAHYLRFVTGLMGRWPLASLDAGVPYFQIWLACVYLLGLGIVLARHRWRQAGLSLLCVAGLLAGAVGLNALAVRRAQLTVTALDVGQGASTLLLSGGEAVLVDCGGSALSPAGDIAADRLAGMGETGLDALVLTHLDDDHFNGVAQLLYRLEVRAIYAPASALHSEAMGDLQAMAGAEGAVLTLVDETLTLPLGAATLTLYPPLGGGTSNEEGLFVQCSQGDFDLLITGDADSFVEEMLVKYYPVPDLELLLVGHHGSGHSTCRRLLDALRPELAVISVGYNTYGHPAPETLERLEQAGSQIYRTDRSGSVTVTLRNGLVSVG